MIDRTTAEHGVEPAEVEARLHNLCGYHLAEPDPLTRYAVLTREQVLYEGLVAAIRRERGRALAEVTRSGQTIGQVAHVTNLGSGLRVHRLISLAGQTGIRETESAAESPTVIEGPDLVEVTSVTEWAEPTESPESAQPPEPAQPPVPPVPLEQMVEPVDSAWFDTDASWRRYANPT